MRRLHLLFAAKLFLLAAIALPLDATADEITCGPLMGSWVGPWDYNDPMARVPTGDAPQTRIKLVENTHFRPEHESLTMRDQRDLAADIIYTLRVFPNHPRALNAMSRLETRHHGTIPGKRVPWETADCFFDRAIRFRPEDPMVRQVQGIHLHSRKNYVAARDAFLASKALGGSSAQLDYNLGLTYFALGQYEAARQQAKIAAAQGFPLTGLSDLLRKAGQWHD
jgi:tetratricopeptide (TPR) repeat protein